jgi:hypothetical protein
MKRKGFMSLEMLLVIGVLVAGLAGVFAIYKKIQANNASMQLTQDIATIVNGLDRFKGATGGYPLDTATGGTGTTTFSAAAAGMKNLGTTYSTTNEWNEGSAYVATDVAAKWDYVAVADSDVDAATGTATGYILVKTSQAKYSALKATEIRDILRGKCLNGTNGTAITGSTTISSTDFTCVLVSNTVLYKVK